MSITLTMIAHFVPFEIDHQGEANVSSYFITDSLPDGSIKSSFRGKGLVGVKHKFENGIKGLKIKRI